jgi:hypothetical protein
MDHRSAVEIPDIVLHARTLNLTRMPAGVGGRKGGPEVVLGPCGLPAAPLTHTETAYNERLREATAARNSRASLRGADSARAVLHPAEAGPVLPA